jgi:DNA mismatch repair protein MutS
MRARQILIHLESQRLNVEEAMEEAGISPGGLGIPHADRRQMSLFEGFSDPVAARIRERVEKLDPERLTPIDALIALSELKRLSEDAASPDGDS